MRRWYARRGISWLPLLACCALALSGAVLAQAWPSQVAGFLPEILAVSAAGAGFVYDEQATDVVAVTPRGAGWRRTTRTSVGLVPLATWSVVVLAVTDLERASWLLVGVCVVLLTVAAAGLASRAGAATPGPAVASVVAMALIAPHLMSQLVGWALFPYTPFSTSVTAFWASALLAAVLALAYALRPGLR